MTSMASLLALAVVASLEKLFMLRGNVNFCNWVAKGTLTNACKYFKIYIPGIGEVGASGTALRTLIASLHLKTLLSLMVRPSAGWPHLGS